MDLKSAVGSEAVGAGGNELLSLSMLGRGILIVTGSGIGSQDSLTVSWWQADSGLTFPFKVMHHL